MKVFRIFIIFFVFCLAVNSHAQSTEAETTSWVDAGNISNNRNQCLLLESATPRSLASGNLKICRIKVADESGNTQFLNPSFEETFIFTQNSGLEN